MAQFDLLKDMAERTGGDIYLGIVGPVRTGKSTFIKRFMELLVLPNIDDDNVRERTRDELPQSGAGRTIMTVEPKFIPDEAVELVLKPGLSARIRLVDCVGYAVKGARGYADESGPRMVQTPWHDEPITFEAAAEIGTQKVIEDHSTVGIVITADGSFSDIAREEFVAAEERVVDELKRIGKPFLLILNSSRPNDPETLQLRNELEKRLDLTVLALNCAKLTEEDIATVLKEALYEFPVKDVRISLPTWIEVLEKKHYLRTKLEEAVSDGVKIVTRLRDIDRLIEELSMCDAVQEVVLQQIDLANGVAKIELTTPEHLYYDALTEAAGEEVRGQDTIMRLLKILTVSKREYERIRHAYRDSRVAGYGISPPSLEEMALDQPEIIRQGNRFGVRLRATAPSFHIIRVDVESEVAPIVGTEKQSEELIKYLVDEFEANPEKLWEANIFGKSLQHLVREGIQNKLLTMPDDAQGKLRECLRRIVNEGSGGLIAIIL
ncbi:MAG: stage IV sporulation protein A [Peptococcaceae bacterium]|nr:stage IV sporulation protein A [Peptococcaceae bacterium]